MSKIVTYEGGVKVVRDMTQDEIDAQVPSTDPRDYPLTPIRWRHMVRGNNLWDHIDTVKASLKSTDLAAWTDLMATLEQESFDFDKTLVQIEAFAPLLQGVTLPDEAALTIMWMAAK